MMGQVDIALTQAREAVLHPHLDKGFVASLKVLNRTQGGDSSCFKANRLFHERLDTVVSRRSKETKLNRVLATTSQRYSAHSQSRSKWGKEDRWIISLNVLILTLRCH